LTADFAANVGNAPVGKLLTDNHQTRQLHSDFILTGIGRRKEPPIENA
jgi:hypothetical protein